MTAKDKWALGSKRQLGMNLVPKLHMIKIWTSLEFEYRGVGINGMYHARLLCGNKRRRPDELQCNHRTEPTSLANKSAAICLYLYCHSYMCFNHAHSAVLTTLGYQRKQKT
jgi:hypothetical protein